MRQTLAQAVMLARFGQSKDLARAASALDGCPVGGWPETQQARRAILDDLPVRSLRAYTLDEWISAVYTVDYADRYRTR
jgi:hypothetical protein